MSTSKMLLWLLLSNVAEVKKRGEKAVDRLEKN